MLRYNGLIALLFLFIEVQRFTSACFAPPQPEISIKCSEELGINKIYAISTPELEHNRTCLNKCMYEKQGKLDADGNFVKSKFPEDKGEALEECEQLIKIKDLCRRTDAIDNCIYQKTDPYMKRYESCEKYKTYNEDPKEPLYSNDVCYSRCQMIIDESLDKNGNINFTQFLNPLNVNITKEEAFEKCRGLVKEEDPCSRDVNLYYCFSYMLYHWSSEQLQYELECSKETDVYPFFGAQSYNISRTCYDRCLLVKSGDIDKEDIFRSAFIKKMNSTEKAIEACQLDDASIDECTKDMYVYDCVNYIQYANPDYLKKQIECAKETNSHVVSLRNQGFMENSCQTRCIMIKETQLNSDGSVNKEHIKRYSINETIINESIEECNKNNKNHTCKEDVDAYHCTLSTIHQKNHILCEEQNKDANASPISVGANLCYSRCIMVLSGQLGNDGEIILDSFSYLEKEPSVLKMAIENCKDKIRDDDKCAQDVNTYNCVGAEAWQISDKLNNTNNVNSEEINGISKI